MLREVSVQAYDYILIAFPWGVQGPFPVLLMKGDENEDGEVKEVRKWRGTDEGEAEEGSANISHSLAGPADLFGQS